METRRAINNDIDHAQIRSGRRVRWGGGYASDDQIDLLLRLAPRTAECLIFIASLTYLKNQPICGDFPIT
jgi:hypothetical protein